MSHYYTSQLKYLFPIRGEHVKSHGSKLTNSLHRETTAKTFDLQLLSLCTLKLRQICWPAGVTQTILSVYFSHFELGGITSVWPCRKQSVLVPLALPWGTLRVSERQNSLGHSCDFLVHYFFCLSLVFYILGAFLRQLIHSGLLDMRLLALYHLISMLCSLLE